MSPAAYPYLLLAVTERPQLLLHQDSQTQCGTNKGNQKVPHRLLEDLVGVDLLAQNAVRRAPEIGEELLVLLVGLVDLSPGVVGGIGVLVQHGLDVLAADQPASHHAIEGLVGVLEDVHVAERVLAQRVRALDEAGHQVGGHESARVLLVVHVLADPARPALLIEHRPELVHHRVEVAVRVRVDALPVVQIERRRRQQVQRVLRLALARGLLLLLLFLRLLLLLLLFLRLLLLLRLLLRLLLLS